MIWFKACPRCQAGDLNLAEDIYGKYLQCIQCGHVLYPGAEATEPRAVPKTTVKRRIAA
jgi:hypothetical protein